MVLVVGKIMLGVMLFMIDKWYFTDVTFGDPTGSHLDPKIM
jgi:hypothetical protein